MKLSWVLFSVEMGLLVLAGPATALNSFVGTMGQPGFLVIEGAADSSGIHERASGTDPGHHSLIWDQGKLTLPDSIPLENWGPLDLGVSFSAELSGSGASGQLALTDGIFPITEPIQMTDGRILFEVSSGEIEVRGARITYRRETTAGDDFKSGLLLLAGMTLLVIVLLRRVRLKSAKRVGN